jgi:hypothetical protein
MPRYSDLQVKTFYSLLITTTLGGKINMLHYYYFYIFPVERQRRILYLFCRCPHEDHSVLHEILNQLNLPSDKGLEGYLESIQDSQTDSDLMAKVDAYIADENRCGSCSKIFGIE